MRILSVTPALVALSGSLLFAQGKPATKAPAGYKILPHFHPMDEIVQVKSGDFLYGMGDTFDVAKAKHMKVGEKGTIPAAMHHYAMAKRATVVTVSATGPFAMTYVNAKDDPRNQAAKP